MPLWLAGGLADRGPALPPEGWGPPEPTQASPLDPMTALRSRANDARSQLTFYYQLVFVVTAALLAMHTLTRLVLATERGTNPALILGIEGAMSLLAVLAIEVERLKKAGPTSLRDWFFAGIGLLQVALCLSTGGISSPYFL